ncbi:MAG: metallophosphoesterase, partial [Gammaproteobacteria bacterium AqS3]|nr:metallophosphoesterase [Gammaproteobacteria bacterium AqS3]
MATYAIGDIQGCREEFERLLERVDFRPGRDALWIAGDAVNRGPDSLGTLRLLHELRRSTTCVLGNHDLSLLRAARERGGGRCGADLMSIIDAPDADELLDWVRGWKFIHTARVPRSGGGETRYLMVHAGVPAERSAKQLRELDRDLRKSPIRSWWGGNRGIVKFLTQVRFVNAAGEP